MSTAKINRSPNLHWIYAWLMLSSLITVPWMIVVSATRDLFLTGLIGIIAPALVHLVLLGELTSSNLYARRHAQQALFLIGVRVFTALLFICWIRVEYLWFFVNGSFWFLGSVLGISEIRHGESGLMRLLGETSLLPGKPSTARQAPVAPVTPQVAQPIIASIATPAPRSVLGVPHDPSTALELGRVLVSEGNRAQAIECFMFVFRNGSPELRQRAVAEMEKLGEVENG